MGAAGSTPSLSESTRAALNALPANVQKELLDRKWDEIGCTPLKRALQHTVLIDAADRKKAWTLDSICI
jgi:hypothetical protein